MEEEKNSTEENDLEEMGLPFANARVVRIIKENLKREHQIKKDVKVAANRFLGEILADIAKRMDEENYYTLSIEHFNRAAKKYREVELNQKRLVKIKKLLEKQRAELDEYIAEIETNL